ncbi:hypothetical protein Tco_1273403 [Tanacetum coccineum]
MKTKTGIATKARLVAKGYAQEEGIDFRRQSFAPLLAWRCQDFWSIAYAAHKSFQLSDGHENAFLNGSIEGRRFQLERHSPLAQQRLTVNPQMVQIKISLTHMNVIKLSMSVQSLHFTEIIFKCTQMIKRTAMASADNTSGPAPQRKEKCMLHSSGPTLHEMKPATISSGLVPNAPPSTLFVPPSRIDWDLVFQPLFDKLLNPSSSVDCPAAEVIASSCSSSR